VDQFLFLKILLLAFPPPHPARSPGRRAETVCLITPPHSILPYVVEIFFSPPPPPFRRARRRHRPEEIGPSIFSRLRFRHKLDPSLFFPFPESRNYIYFPFFQYRALLSQDRAGGRELPLLTFGASQAVRRFPFSLNYAGPRVTPPALRRRKSGPAQSGLSCPAVKKTRASTVLILRRFFRTAPPPGQVQKSGFSLGAWSSPLASE